MPRSSRSTGRLRPSDDAGIALPWFALTLLVMFAMAGFGVDVWSWWYTAQKEQRAADAGALAGVVFMPGGLTDGTATTTAERAVQSNGFSPSDALVEPGERPNQLKVTVTKTVANNFVSLLGIGSTTISRSATAEYNAPVEMASPEAHTANDPESTAPLDQHWLTIGAPGVDKTTGDRFADHSGSCPDSTYKCSGGVNTEYSGDTYIFTIDVPVSVVGRSVDIQVYDPAYANGGTTCDQNWGGLDAASIDALQAAHPDDFGPDAHERYATGVSKWCTGDDNTNLGPESTPQSTVWIVRDSSVNALSPLVNPVVGTGGTGPGGACAKQFKGYNSNFYELLNPDSPSHDEDFLASFHRWYTVCSITPREAGKYFLQVRSAVPFRSTPSISNLTSSQDPPEETSIAGQNRFAIRAWNSGTSTYASGVRVYAQTRLPIYSNVLDTSGGLVTPLFYLARLLPGGGSTGRTLQLVFYDIGDVGCVRGAPSGCGVTSMQITPPDDIRGATTSCTWSFNDTGGPLPPGAAVSGCSASNMRNNAFNGQLVRVSIAVPSGYTCDVDRPTGCWFRIRMRYTAGTQANDTTTWVATIGGDPVRLVK